MPDSGNEAVDNEVLNLRMAIIGVVVIVILVCTFLYGEVHKIDTTPILAILSPVIGALFLIKPLSHIGSGVRKTQTQTNGHLSAMWERNMELARENREYKARLAVLEGTVTEDE